MNNETAEIAESISGEKAYQERARRALPILVRQALAHHTIYYADLARELMMPNPRNLNFVLGSVGKALMQLGAEWKVSIPPLQCLVINQSDELPGEGIGWFITKADFRAMTRRDQTALVDGKLAEIFAYQKWRSVLRALNLPEPSFVPSELISSARKLGSGESDAHRELKEWLAGNPAAVSVPASFKAAVEYALPSGDAVDIVFRGQNRWISVEVKSHISSEADILRGMFQCVKYRAVTEAMLALQGNSDDVEVYLALESVLPPSLITAKSALGVSVLERVRKNPPVAG